MNVFELFKEEAAGVGVIASKKQKNDPRYSHSLTVDVRPDTPKKNRKALGLTESPRADGSFENRDEYYKEMYPMALKAVSKLGLQIPPELLVTQWGFESGWGSKVSGDNNFFGIKADKGYKGDSKEVATHEYEDGKKVNIKDKFRSYDSLDDAVDDYVDFIKNNPRYTEAGVFDAKNSEEYMAALQKAGYATDPEYADKILKQEKITKKQIAKVVPPEEQEKLKAEQPTVSATPKAEEEPKQNIDAIATLQTAFQKAMKDGDGKAMNDILQNIKALGGDKAMQSVAKNEYNAGDISPERQNRAAVAVTPATDTPEYDAFGNVVTDKGFDPDNKKAQQATNQAARIAKRQSAEDQKRAELEKRSKSRGQSVSPSLDAERRDIGKDTASTTTKTDTSVTATPAGEEEESYAEMGKKALPDSLSVKREELEDAQAKLDALTLNGTQEEVAQAQADVDRIEQAVQYNLDVQAGKDVVGGGGTLTKDETDYLKAKQGALMQGKDDVTSIADDDLNRRRAEAYANQQEGMGNTEVADFARAEAKRHEALRNQKLTKGITFGQGSLEQQEQQMKQWDKTKAEGGDPTQSWKGGVITDPKELTDWQKRNQEADKLQKEKGQWNITKTIDDYSADVSSSEQEVQKAEPEEPKSTTAAKTSYSGAVASTGGASSKGGGYGQGAEVDATVSATPKVDPYPNPGYTGEELRIYNQLSDAQKAKVTSDFEKSKKYTDQQRKNITPRTGPTSIPDAKPRSLLDIKHQQTLSKIEGGKVLVDPVQDREISKALTKNYPNVQARNAAIEKLRYTAPSMQDIQKGMTPIVDKSINKDEKTNANVPAADTSDAQSSIGKAVQPGTNLGKDNASQQAQDLQKQKAERQAKIDQQNAERQAKIDQQKAEQAAKKAEQQAKQEARKAEDERKRQERQAEQERRVSGSTRTVGAPVGESAIFRAIMRK